MKTLNSVKERISSLHSENNHLAAFVLQAMYIESLVRSYADARLKVGTGLGQIDSKLLNMLIEEINKKRTSDLLAVLKRMGWLSAQEKLKLKNYFDFRNQVIHKLSREVRNRSFLENLKKEYISGVIILSFPPFKNTDAIMAILDENRSIYGNGKIFNGDQLTEKQINSALTLSLEGKTPEQISKKLEIGQHLVRQIIRNRLATLIDLKISLKGYTKKTDKEKAEKAIKEIRKTLDVKKSDIYGLSRIYQTTFARHLVMYLLHEKLNLSYPRTSKTLGRSDHTTAVSAVKKIKKLINKKRVKIVTDID